MDRLTALYPDAHTHCLRSAGPIGGLCGNTQASESSLILRLLLLSILLPIYSHLGTPVISPVVSTVKTPVIRVQ